MARTNALNGDLQFSSNLPVSGVNVGANSALIVTTSSGFSESTSALTDGQIVIGSTSATPTAATITAGSGITVTNGAGSITIAASGGAAANGLLNVQYLTTTGTYTATAGTVSCVVVCVGGGGGSGGLASTTGTGLFAASSGGGGGAWTQRYYSSAPSSASFTIGAAGAAGASGANPGGAGGATSFNSDFTSGGGSGGVAGTAFNASTRGISYLPTLGGSPSGTYDAGGSGEMSVSSVIHAGGNFLSGSGGSSMLGSGARGRTSGGVGDAATTLGSGGSGCATSNPGGPYAGGAGAAGIIIVYEYGA